jgi:hypothetical protein
MSQEESTMTKKKAIVERPDEAEPQEEAEAGDSLLTDIAQAQSVRDVLATVESLPAEKRNAHDVGFAVFQATERIVSKTIRP